MLVDGLLARTAELGGRSAMQLLGRGDVFDPWAHREELLPCDVRWHAYEPCTVAALDARFAAARRWPALSIAIQSRLDERADRLAAQAASLPLSNVDQRLIAHDQATATTFQRLAPRGVLTSAVSPARSPRRAWATGESMDSRPFAASASSDETSS